MSSDRNSNRTECGHASPLNGMQPLPMAEWVAVLFDLIIRKYGGETTLNEFRVMNQITMCHLRGSSPCTFPCLASNTPVKRSTISRVVSRLVQRGYIREETDPRDRRRRLIYLTKSFVTEVRGHFKLLRVAPPEESRGSSILGHKCVKSNSNIGVKNSSLSQASQTSSASSNRQQ
jgi:DNA-binding MarR family transcriptional regulator